MVSWLGRYALGLRECRIHPFGQMMLQQMRLAPGQEQRQLGALVVILWGLSGPDSGPELGGRHTRYDLTPASQGWLVIAPRLQLACTSPIPAAL